MNTVENVDVLERSFKAMGSNVHVRVENPTLGTVSQVDAVETLFQNVHRECTRFDPTSELMRLNETGQGVVGPRCAAIIKLAHGAHEATGGVFDPRILQTLRGLGYVNPTPEGGAGHGVRVNGQWDVRYENHGDGTWLDVGPDPIDLGGIGKGWTVSESLALLQGAGQACMINAGGDCASYSLTDRTWVAGVEDLTGADILAAVDFTNAAVATSSTRVKKWHAEGTTRHHLIDPATGMPAGTNIASVTVVCENAAWAEVWSKTILIRGIDEAKRGNVAAFWVLDTGDVGFNAKMQPHLTWVRP